MEGKISRWEITPGGTLSHCNYEQFFTQTLSCSKSKHIFLHYSQMLNYAVKQ